MAQVTLKGGPVQVNGELPKIGAQAPAFSLVGEGLADKSLKDYAGKRKVRPFRSAHQHHAFALKPPEDWQLG